MSNLNKVDVPIALEHKTKLDLSFDHLTTMGFVRTQPVMYRHMVKTEHLIMEASSSVRPMPIEVPIYGQIKQNLRAFFVPYRLVFPQWHQFYNDVIGSNYSGSSLVSSPPTLPMEVLIDMFTDQSLVDPLSSTDPLWTDGDFYFNGAWYNYTTRGRRYLCMLESLGYKIIWDHTIKKGDENFYNGLALLAYAKVYLDWYSNSQYLNTPAVLRLEQILAFNDPTNNYIFTKSDLYDLLTYVVGVVYDNEDYYVNAWDNPVSPNSGQYTQFSFLDPTATNGAYVVTNSLGSPEMIAKNPSYSVADMQVPPVMRSVLGSPAGIGTTYIHEALKKLTDFQKRHSLAGARAIDRVLAQYGIVTDALKMQRSIYVGSQQVDVECGSIYATANGVDSNGNYSTVGDYAGAGFGKGAKQWDFAADEEGIFLVIASIIPSGQLVQGYDRNNRHITKSDFFVPEFDSLGVQAIEKGEVFVSDSESFGALSGYEGVFGFSGRYGEMKRPKSFLTGDLRLSKFYSGAGSWHLFRLLDNQFSNVSQCVHSLAFTRADINGAQYNRIFQEITGEHDPFFCFFHFNVASYMPCKPLFETYEFENNAKAIPTSNGNKVN